MAQPLSMPQQGDLLTTAAAVLLTRSLNETAERNSDLGASDIFVPSRYAISHTGPGTRRVSALEAWYELLDRGLVSGTADAWRPAFSAQEVTSQ